MWRLFLVMVVLSLAVAGCASSDTAPAPASQAPVSAPVSVPTYPQVTVASQAAGPQATEPVVQRAVRLKIAPSLDQVKSFVDYPLMTPSPSSMSVDIKFLQGALLVGQRVGGDISTPVPVGVPIVEFLYRGGVDNIIMNQAKGTVDDILWRFPNLKSSNRQTVTVRGKPASLSGVQNTDDTLYWEEDGRVYVMGGRIATQELLKAAEGLESVK